jgi:enamine deaminase RidA (YjgF/YER057c/UK114 family)
MARRQSVSVHGTQHVNPIPNACRIGNLLVSGAIGGIDPETGKLPGTVAAQCTNMFRNLRAIVEAGGASTDDIIKLTVYLRDRSDRTALNAEWVKMFPDEDSRPARHSQQLPADSGAILVQCDFMAVIGG